MRNKLQGCKPAGNLYDGHVFCYHWLSLGIYVNQTNGQTIPERVKAATPWKICSFKLQKRDSTKFEEKVQSSSWRQCRQMSPDKESTYQLIAGFLVYTRIVRAIANGVMSCMVKQHGSKSIFWSYLLYIAFVWLSFRWCSNPIVICEQCNGLHSWRWRLKVSGLWPSCVPLPTVKPDLQPLLATTDSKSRQNLLAYIVWHQAFLYLILHVLTQWRTVRGGRKPSFPVLNYGLGPCPLEQTKV